MPTDTPGRVRRPNNIRRRMLLRFMSVFTALVLIAIGIFTFRIVAGYHAHKTLAATAQAQSAEGAAATSAPRPTATTQPVPMHNGRLHINSVGPLYQTFNDSNKFQLEAARRIGIDPISNLSSAFHTRRPIVEIKSCDTYLVDTLTHSLPYLVPEAAALLSDISRAFVDSLASRSAYGYRIKVTSLLRTPHTVKKLRRVNVNATDSSTHQFGTTFDISYTKFHCVDSTLRLPQEDLKNLLAEVLADFRDKNRCLVKYERKTACFHVTAR